MTDATNIHEWLADGVANGYIGTPTCSSHNHFEMYTDDELIAYDNGHDPCVWVVRLNQ